MPFAITIKPEERLIEVVYPAQPTPEEVTDYAARIRKAIDDFGGLWCCLVDQRELKVMPPEVADAIGKLNAYAERRGMLRGARIVSSAVASLQTSRLARDAKAGIEIRAFQSRDEAIAWLKSAASPKDG
jgi:hypothetical protein